MMRVGSVGQERAQELLSCHEALAVAVPGELHLVIPQRGHPEAP